jgi:hypothetical protein
MSAVTVHSPGFSPYTHDVIDTGPLPGTMPSILSSWPKVSLGLGCPWIPSRRPVNRIVAEYGSPSCPESNQWLTTSASGSTVDDAPVPWPALVLSVPAGSVPDPGLAPAIGLDRALGFRAVAAGFRRATCHHLRLRAGGTTQESETVWGPTYYSSVAVNAKMAGSRHGDCGIVMVTLRNPRDG